MINDFCIIKDINLLKTCNVVLYGASSTGKKVLSLLRQAKIDVLAFCDTSPKECVIDGVTVITPQELKDKYDGKDLLIIITSTYIAEIFEILISLELQKDNKIITYHALYFAIDSNYDSDIFPYGFAERYLAQKRFESVVIEQSYLQITRELDFTHLLEIANSEQPILVYQPGKVGSKTIYNSLQRMNIPVVHLHRLAWNENLWKHDFHNCKESYEYYLKQIKSKKIKIITAVREPISRDLSNFMHNLADGRWMTYGYMRRNLNETFESVIDNYYVDKKMEHSTYSWLDLSWNQGLYGQMFEWFDYELKDVFGIDVFEYPFDKERGYQIIEKDNIEVLIYKLEKLPLLENVFCEFLNVAEFRLKSDNVASEKSYRYLYNEFKKHLQIPVSYLELYYKGNSRMDHFYTWEEKKAFQEKWESYIG